MSYTVNGIGTHVYGSDRELTREDQCEHCGRHTVLTSYDATNYFVVVFVPVIPLGKLRILNHCGSCQRWSQMPLKEWESSKEEAIRQSLDGMRANPSDPDAVKTALVTATQFQDEGILLQFKQVADNFRADADVQGLLGATLSYFGRNPEAIGAYEASLAADDQQDTHEQLALEYSLAGQPEKAEPHLSHIWSSDQSEKVGFGVSLARGYQAKGDHATAIARLDKIAELHPEIANDGEFKRIVREAEKYQRKGKPVPQATKTNNKYREKSSTSSVAKWVFPGILTFGLLAYLAASFVAGMNRDVVLVNGLDQAYTVTVGTADYTLQPNDWQRVKVAEGSIPVGATINGVSLPEETHVVRTPFFGRLNSKTLFVINPDRTAVIEKEEFIYSQHGDIGDPDFERFVGDSYYEFESIEHPFESAPSEVDLSTSSSVVKRDCIRLSPLANMPEVAALSQLSMSLEAEQMTDYLLRRFELGSSSDALLGLLSERIEPTELLDRLQPRLDDKPVNVAVHRAYQQSTETAHPDQDLESEYGERLSKQPENGDLAYLLARVTADTVAKNELLVRSTQANPPSAYGFNALAYDALSRGDAEQGLEPSKTAMEMEPDIASFHGVRTKVLEATGRFDEALELMHSSFTGGTGLGQLQRISLDTPILVAAGKYKKAKQDVDDLMDQIVGHAPPAVEESFTLALRGQLAYAARDAEGLRELAINATTENVPVYIHLALNNVVAASKKQLSIEDDEDSDSNLAIYIAAQMAKRNDLAELHLNRAVELLRHGDRDKRTMADALGPDGVSDPAVLKDVALWPEGKRIFMAALAVRFLEDFDEYSQLAKKSNYKLTSPYWLIKGLKSR